jgi:CO dehydrogenase maturation factor
MGYTIAITGKGGTGKTTISGLIIKCLIDQGKRPVLAIDADPNSCLDALLGVQAVKSVGSVREEAREIVSSGGGEGIAKRDLLELKIAESLVEGEHFDLIAMGRPEGPGCYCYANNVLREVIREVCFQYPFIVIDNEAGLENVSRRIVQKVDLLILAGDPSINGIKTLQRLQQLAHEMGLHYEKIVVVVNRLRNHDIPAAGRAILNQMKIDGILLLPYDEDVAILAEEGGAIFTLAASNAVVKMIDGFIKNIFNNLKND